MACAKMRHPAQTNYARRRIFFPFALAQRTTQWERGDEPDDTVLLRWRL